MDGDDATTPAELIHLTYDGNFQLETDARVLLCRVIDDGGTPRQPAKVNNAGGGDVDCDGEEGPTPRTTIDVPVEIRLDVTTMHPQGGGQPTDTGTITVVANKGVEGSSSDESTTTYYTAKIDKVTIDRATGLVTHVGSVSLPVDGDDNAQPVADPGMIFPPNATVRVSVDSDNRLLLSECHTAGHVVDAAMARCGMLLPPTKGYHFLDGPYVEYKGGIDAKEREEFLARLKVAYQELIDEDIPTNIQTLPVDEADALCNRLAQNFDVKDFTSPTDTNPSVRVVTVAGWHCPCGGTHVRSTGVLGGRGWRVRGMKCKKGVVRVKYGPGGEG